MTRLILLLLFVELHFAGLSQNFNRPAPNSSGQYEFVKIDTSVQNKYYLHTPFPILSTGSNFLYLIDEDGYIAWWSEHLKKFFDFKYHPEQNEYLFTRKETNGPSTYHFEMDNSFNIIDSIKSVNGADGDIHEFQIFPNGNRCILTSKDSIMDLSAVLINGTFGTANTSVIASIIQEFNP
ncbi:MAG: hypothetical protein HRT57_08030, partial [Crocinitomicaceae bacterium]|nr:hypothetical protein [Crocinitomicaceae bacterium]